MKYPGKVPQKSRAIFTPVKLTCAQPGVYSIGLKWDTASKILARKLHVNLPNQEINIDSAAKFECPIKQVGQAVEVYLLSDREEILVGGLVPIFDEFSALEPPEDSKMSELQMFEPQQLRYRSISLNPVACLLIITAQKKESLLLLK